MRHKWVISDEKRVRLEESLDVINRDFCDFINGMKPRRDFPMVGSFRGNDRANNEGKGNRRCVKQS